MFEWIEKPAELQNLTRVVSKRCSKLYFWLPQLILWKARLARDIHSLLQNPGQANGCLNYVCIFYKWIVKNVKVLVTFVQHHAGYLPWHFHVLVQRLILLKWSIIMCYKYVTVSGINGLGAHFACAVVWRLWMSIDRTQVRS
jgi:hypothetical protein